MEENWSKAFQSKSESSKFMASEISYICKNLPKRSPGSDGERKASEYMAKVLKEQNCDEVKLETFVEHPLSFYFWVYFFLSVSIVGSIVFFFVPIVSVVLVVLGLTVMIIQFVFYKKTFDFLFPKKEGTNVMAIKKPTQKIKARIVLNGHSDASWNWRVNNKFGGKVYEAHIVISFVGAILLLIFSLISSILTNFQIMTITPFGDFNYLFWIEIGLICIFIFPWIAMYFLVDYKNVVDGANDNLSGCYIGISILKSLKDNGIKLENVELCVLITGSEEAGLRGAKAWCIKHKDDFKDVSTYFYCFDTIHDSKFLAVNTKDLNGTVKADEGTYNGFLKAAQDLNIPCRKEIVPLFGGATDSAAFNQAGFKAVGVTALNHVLENYYHTVKDSSDNLNEKCLEDTFSITLRAIYNLEKNLD